MFHFFPGIDPEKVRRLSLIDYTIPVSIGAYEEEKRAPQPVIFSIDVWVTHVPHFADDLNAVFDYTLIPQAIHQASDHCHTVLQETLVERIASLLCLYPDVLAVRVQSRKPQAYPGAQAVGVEIFRRAHHDS